VAEGALYLARSGLPQSVSVVRTVPVRPSGSNLPSLAVVGDGFEAVVETNGDGVRSVSSSTPSVCSASGLSVRYLAVGTCTLVAHVGLGHVYEAASGVGQSFSVVRA